MNRTIRGIFFSNDKTNHPFKVINKTKRLFVFIHRSMFLSASSATSCIIIPYPLDSRDEWISGVNRVCASDRDRRSIATSTSVRRWSITRGVTSDWPPGIAGLFVVDTYTYVVEEKQTNKGQIGLMSWRGWFVSEARGFLSVTWVV